MWVGFIVKRGSGPGNSLDILQGRDRDKVEVS